MADKGAFEKGSKGLQTIHHNKKAGGSNTKVTDDKYAKAKFIDGDKSKSVEDVRKKYAPSADKPTTASAQKGGKNLPQTVKDTIETGTFK